MRPHQLCLADPATDAPVLSQPAKSPKATELCDLTNCALRIQRPTHQYCPNLRSRRRQLSYATSPTVPCGRGDAEGAATSKGRLGAGPARVRLPVSRRVPPRGIEPRFPG